VFNDIAVIFNYILTESVREPIFAKMLSKNGSSSVLMSLFDRFENRSNASLIRANEFNFDFNARIDDKMDCTIKLVKGYERIAEHLRVNPLGFKSK
jgi:hypothetical protein